MNFLRNRTNKQNSDPSNSRGERNRPAFISKLIVTGLASAGLFLAGCAEAKEAPQTPTPVTTSVSSEATPIPTPRERAPAPATPEQADIIKTDTIKNIQKQAHERWPGTTCAFAFYKGEVNIDVTNPGLKAAIEELVYQGNPGIVPESLAGQEPENPDSLTPQQKEVIRLSTQYIVDDVGRVDNPSGRIGICEVPQGTAISSSRAWVPVDRGPSDEVTNK